MPIKKGTKFIIAFDGTSNLFVFLTYFLEENTRLIQVQINVKVAKNINSVIN